jgi:hypothetical protein
MPPITVNVDTARGPLEISCFPGDDLEFGMTVVQTAFDVRHRPEDRDSDIASWLTGRLRRAYPAAQIQTRHELASWDASRLRLYAFRDGGAGRPGQDHDSRDRTTRQDEAADAADTATGARDVRVQTA